MRSEEIIYDPDPPRRVEAERVLRAGSVDEVCDTLALLQLPHAGVHTGGDWAWLGVACLRLLTHPRAAVRASAARGLAALARSHPELRRGPAAPALERLRADADADVALEAERALEEFGPPGGGRGEHRSPAG